MNKKKFLTCKYLLLDIPVDKANEFDEIDSIDEAAEKLDHSQHNGIFRYEIDPATEFWGHCSNMQVWVENNYDTRLIHKNISFPLLKKLTDLGDPIARKVFKEEIAGRIKNGYGPVISYLIEEGYLKYLNEDELSVVNDDLRKNLNLFFKKQLADQFEKSDLDFKKNNIFKIVKDLIKTESNFKICSIGDNGIGQSSFVSSFKDFFNKDEKLTIGINLFTKIIDVHTGIGRIKCKLNLWNFELEHRFLFFLPSYCRGASLVIFLFDLTNRKFLNNLHQYIEIIKQGAGNIPILLVGHKDNLEKPPILTEEIENFIQYLNLYYREVSFTTKEGIEKIDYMIFCLSIENWVRNINNGSPEFHFLGHPKR